MKSKRIETLGASADNRAKLSNDRPAAVEEVTRVVNMTSQRSSLRWDESYKPLPIGAHIRSVGKQELGCSPWEWRNVKRRIRKSCRTQSINQRRHKANRPGFICLTAWCLLPFFVTGWPREVTFDRHDLVWYTKQFQMPWKGTRLTWVKELSLSVLATPGKHSIW